MKRLNRQRAKRQAHGSKACLTNIDAVDFRRFDDASTPTPANAIFMNQRKKSVALFGR